MENLVINLLFEEFRVNYGTRKLSTEFTKDPSGPFRKRGNYNPQSHILFLQD